MKGCLVFSLLCLISLSAFAFYTNYSTLLLNPVPNQAPYLLEVSDDTYSFNPFAIQEVRYAINDLISRQYFVDNLTGLGSIYPLYLPIGYSEAYFSEGTILDERDFSYEGHEERAIGVITQALTNAASLPELSDRLIKQADGFWYFDGERVTVKHYVRTEDDYRQQTGEYISEQLEKAGFEVETILATFSEVTPIVYYSDPALLEWSAYTEWWGSPAPRFSHVARFRVFMQMYAPCFNYMPGRNIPGFWSYTNELIDKKADDFMNKIYFSETEMKSLYLDVLKLGLNDSVRIWLFGFVFAN